MAKQTDRTAYPLAIPAEGTYILGVDPTDTSKSPQGTTKAFRYSPEMTVRDFGAVGDCTGPDTGTDDSAAFQAAFDWLVSEAATAYGATLTIPRRRYRIADTVMVNFGGAHGPRVKCEGWVTPDTTLATGFVFRNANEGKLEMRVWGGGSEADYSQADPSGGTQAIVLRGWRAVDVECRAWAYLGRVLRTTRQEDGIDEFKTAFLKIHMLTGHVSEPYSRCGQALFADDAGVGDAQGAWGTLDAGLHWDQYGPVWEDLNDVEIYRMEGSARQYGIQFRGVRVMNIGYIYYGETPGQSFYGSGAYSVYFTRSQSGTNRKCARITGGIIRTLAGNRGVYAVDMDETSPSLTLEVHGNGVDGALVTLENVSRADLKIYPTACYSALVMSNSCEHITAHVVGEDFESDAISISSSCENITLTGTLTNGSAGYSLINKDGAGRCEVKMDLVGGDVDQLISLGSAATNNGFYLTGGSFDLAGSDPFNLSRRPEVIRDVRSYRTRNTGIATIPSGSASVTVAHDLARTPSFVGVTGEHSETRSVSATRDGTNITISVPSNVTGDRSVRWDAQAEIFG